MKDFLSNFLTKSKELNKEDVYDARCPFCSVQCSMQIFEERIVSRKVFKVKPNKEDPASEGRLCIKGINAHEHVVNGQRILYPLLKIDDEFHRVSWSLALNYIKEKFSQLQTDYGNDTLGVYGGGSLTNEEAYLLGKFARVALKTKYIDYNGRFCMSSAATAANVVFGIDRGLTCELADIPEAECIILAGTNIAECQPTLMPYFLKAKKKGSFIIVIDPRETPTSKLADLHIKVKPGMDANLVNGMLKVMLEKGYVDRSFVMERTNGFEDLQEFLQSIDLQEISELTDVPVDVIERAAEQYGAAGTGIVFTARGVEQHASGVETVKNFINLALITGKIGRRGCGYGAITGQANGQGGREHGQKADQLPGYRSISHPEHRKYIADVWGIEEADLPDKGVSAYEMMQKIAANEIKGLFVMGSNPVVSNPNAIFVEKALGQLEFLVVADLFLSETARMADVILPTTSYLEDTGTLTNLEGRVVLREGTRRKLGEAKHDWEILCDLANEMGKKDYFLYSAVEEIFEELKVASKGGKADYFGITYQRLKEEKGVYWPCPDIDHPGERSLFERTFAHEDGRAMISAVNQQVPKEMVCQEYPLFLTTGRVMHHYLTGVQTRKSSKLSSLSSEPLLAIHPETAKNYQIEDGAFVKVQSKRGSAVMRASLTPGIREDTLFTTFHWGDLQSVNRVTNHALDPQSKMPEFKVCAVNIILL
ncbi:molybdopterin-dependent oxidoreductase [Bacillus sp. BRMEA1]|uniref:assimilatory nitrate reductase catalytic subunit NasC n=1 Tax=Neobacillus endophyticus TaxID=2738405 RepID=UPI00156452ED|nr:nitrate reductase [Neobacillus endophyticus]NRD77869.1 molybdopterin-dependent oxidoreductase [Neobacillus endophyticus]